jgi:ribokinase
MMENRGNNKGIITIVGAYNVGLFLKGQRLPALGESVTAEQFIEGAGGKGSNQAVTAAMFGSDVRFVARVGDDSYGRYALGLYKRVGISSELVTIDRSIHSGISIILIDKMGRNMISVALGANLKLSPDDIDKALPVIEKSALVGFQFENSLDTVFYGLRKAHEKRVMIFLDPAPAQKIPDEVYQFIDIIKPNETEARIITGIKVDGVETAEMAGRWLIERGVRTAIITLGELGAVLVDKTGARHFAAPKVNAVDSTGAGDIFSGALLSALADGNMLPEALEYATVAAALSTTRLGVIESIPSREEVAQFMRKIGEKGSTRL